MIIDRQLAYRPATTRRVQAASPRPLFAPPKTQAARRVIPLPATVTAALRAHLRAYPPGPAGLLFTTPAGNVLNPANWRQRIWRPLIRSAPGIPAGTTFHRLRHAYAFMLGDAVPTPRSSGGSATLTPARSAGTATPTPTPGTARPPATPSTPPSAATTPAPWPVDFC